MADVFKQLGQKDVPQSIEDGFMGQVNTPGSGDTYNGAGNVQGKTSSFDKLEGAEYITDGL